MQFIFFNAAGTPLFVREDAEQATWTVETLSMVAAFPYDADKVITRAMRIAFEDELGVLQPFEIRKVETMEPDHYQRLTCEHIAISELTDRHMDAQELTNVTAQAALTGILTGTGWAVGNVTATGTSSADLALGSVWQNVRTIEANWNVYITPRVTFNTSGITGRYLDIAPAQGTWRGIRLSLDKNADEMGVVIDDTEVKTALFGYGASTDGVPLTFAAAVWQQTAEHPAKPAGQTYLEDPDATAAYGRNGAARFGFYQNADITDANTLLEKTWEALKATNAPRVTINCMVRDLYRMGYADQPVRLHDTAMVQIRQTNTNLQLEIIQLSVDLLDPTATRPTIGAYIPNIVYIQRDTGREAFGGASNTISGRRGGGGGKSARENQLSEFETEIRQNQYQISLRAYQRDVTNMENILKEAGVAIDASGVIIYAGNNLTQMKSAIQVNAEQIALKVSKGDVATQLSVELGNVTISGGNLVVEGYVSAAAFEAEQAKLNNLMTGQAQASTISTQTLRAGNAYAANLFLNNEEFAKHNIYMGGTTVSGFYLGDANLNLAHYHAITATENNGVITITQGAAQDTAGSASFDIADTQFYKDAVASATAAGKAAMGVLIDQANQSVAVGESATKSALIASTVSLIYNTSNHKYTATTAATANGTTMHTNSAVSGTEAYDAGESDGYTSGYSDGVNDGYATGAASVTVDSVLKYQADDYDSTTHNYTVYVRGTASNGKTLDNSLTVSGASAYNAGNSDGYQTGYNYGYSRGESDGAATEAARYINCGSRYWGYSNNGGATWNWYYSGTMYTRRSS